MYTDEQIAKMTPRVHPAIIMADSWGGSVSDEEYDKKFQQFKTWAMKTKQDIIEKYGKEAGNDFLSVFATSEFKPFFKAGYELDYNYLNKLVEQCPVEKKLPFLKQELTRKLFPIKESITVIALNSNAVWGAKKEFSNKNDLKKNLLIINQHTKNSLVFLAKGIVSGVEYFSTISEKMEKEAGSKKIMTNVYIKALRIIDNSLNKFIYSELTDGFLNTPQ